MAAMKCPKCRGLMITIASSFQAPEHDSCLICGNYREQPIKIALPDFPLPENPRLSSKHRQTCRTAEEKRQKQREAQLRFKDQWPDRKRRRSRAANASPG